MLPEISQIMLILAVSLSFLPQIIYWWKQLAENKSYMVISIFWTINGILYLPDIFQWKWYVPITDQVTLFYNLFDAPLICLIFYYAFEKRIFLFLIASFFMFESIIIVWKGFNMDANTINIGVGCLLCLILNIWGISRYLKKVKHSDGETVLAFVFAGFIFYYGLCVDIVLLSKYLNLSGKQRNYILLINYTSIFLATILISFGFWKYARPSYDNQQIA
jgi:hypothetical protein